MKSKNIALIAGGYSREHEISLMSAATVEHYINGEPYKVYKIVITREAWTYTLNESAYTIDKNDFSLTLNGEKIVFDAAIIMLHGTPGEDGLLQGYFDMLRIPYSTCGSSLSAVTFDKGLCNRLVSSFGLLTARSLYLHKGDTLTAEAIFADLNLPVFVKPAAGGSSFGISKVKAEQELDAALQKAFAEDNSVLIEEFIPGREITCGVFSYKGSLQVFPPTEIISQNEYFDYEAKYKGKSSEITPAQIPDDLLIRCQSLSAMIYKRLNCKGVVRIDYILSEDDFYFLEINTVPGMSSASIVPQQIVEYGLTPEQFYTMIVEDTLWRAEQGR
jgi:D-alanine-D-alanine ligase